MSSRCSQSSRRRGAGWPAAEPATWRGPRFRPRVQGLPHPAGAVPEQRNCQTAGTIEKDTPEGVKQHRFIRADTHPSRDDAIAFAISKAKQIIDLQGDRIFVDAD